VVEISDGLDTLRSVMSLNEIASLIERTARWVSPDTFKLLPLWFPEHARKGSFYKKNWSEPQMNKNRETGNSVHKAEGNRYANEALTLALGLRKKLRPNWSCCHILGNRRRSLSAFKCCRDGPSLFLVRRQYGFASDATQGFYGHDAGGESHAANLCPQSLWLAVRP